MSFMDKSGNLFCALLDPLTSLAVKQDQPLYRGCCLPAFQEAIWPIGGSVDFQDQGSWLESWHCCCLSSDGHLSFGLCTFKMMTTNLFRSEC